jgi:ABC-2 type transport system permease protein
VTAGVPELAPGPHRTSGKATAVYDSAAPPRPLVDELHNVWRYRGLLSVLIRRDIVLRYKRSLLGVWWTLLDPVLTTAVLWVVLSQVFRASIPGVPYVVYLYSGVAVFRYFEQATIAVGHSLVDSSGILSRVYAPAEVFSLSAAAAAGFTFAIGLLPLAVLIVLHGIALSWTIVLLPVPAIALLLMGAGVGLVLASAAVRFYDVLALAQVGLFLLGWLTPTFYPLDAIGPEFRIVVELNPLYHVLEVFRGLAYEGSFAPWWSWLVTVGTALVAFVAGAWVFSRSWRTSVAML